MNMQSKVPITPLRQRMIEDMAARKLGHHSQRSHLSSWCPSINAKGLESFRESTLF